MSNNGPVKIRVDSALATEGAASNVATNQADLAALKAANVDGKVIYPAEARMDYLYARSGVVHGSFRSGSMMVGSGGVSISTAAEGDEPSGAAGIYLGISGGNPLFYVNDATGTSTVSFNGADGSASFKGTIAAGSTVSATMTAGSIFVGSGGVTISTETAGAEPSAAGLFMGITGGAPQIYLKNAAGTVTVRLNGADGSAYFAGQVVSSNIQISSSVSNSVDLSVGSLTVGGTASFNGTACSTVVTNSANGATAFTGTVLYRSTGAPTNDPAPSAFATTTNTNGTVNYQLTWGIYTQGAKQADMLLLFWRKDGSAPTVNDSCIAFNVNTASSSYYLFEGVNGADTWSFGIAAARRTENGLEIGTIQAPTAAPDWRGVTTGTPNYTGNINGATAATVQSGAASGAAAVQPGGGVSVDGSKYITTIDMSSGITIKTSTSTAKTQLTSAGMAIYNSSGNLVVQVDHTNGIWVDNYSSTTSVTERFSVACDGAEKGYLTALAAASAFAEVQLYSAGQLGIISSGKLRLSCASSSYLEVGPGQIAIIADTAANIGTNFGTLTQGGASTAPVGSLILSTGGSIWFVDPSGNYDRLWGKSATAATAHS